MGTLMPRVHCVKKARKDNPAVKKGESYFWWKTRRTIGKSFVGTKHYSATRPRPSRLTSSDFLSQVYSLQERAQDAGADGGTPVESMENLESLAGELADELESLGDEQDEKRDNMPDGLRDSPTGELLEERAEACRAMAEELRGIDFSVSVDDDEAIQKREAEDAESDINGVSYDGG